jgi:hypothetical protein
MARARGAPRAAALARALALFACAATVASLPLGAQLPELNEFGVLWPFADLMKQAAPPLARGHWFPQSSGTNPFGYSWAAGESVVYSPASGFPLSWAAADGAVLLRIGPQPSEARTPPLVPGYPPGRYVLSWRGRGALRLHGDLTADAAGSSAPPLLNGTAGTLTASNMGSGASGGEVALLLRSATVAGLGIAITATNASDHLRGLRLLPAALHAAGPGADVGAGAFSARFLALARRFSLLRFTAWCVRARACVHTRTRGCSCMR